MGTSRLAEDDSNRDLPSLTSVDFVRDFGKRTALIATPPFRNTILALSAIAWLTWLNLPFLVLGPFAYIRSYEMGDAVYPLVSPILRMLAAGRLSLWFPSEAAGTDLMGNLNSPVVNVLLFLAFPHWIAHSLIFLLVSATALVAMYALLRQGFQAARWSALLGGALFSAWFQANGGGHVYTWATGFAYALAPVVLLHLLQVGAGSKRGWAISVALGLAVSMGGHYSWSAFMLAMIGLTAAVVAFERMRIWLPHLLLTGSVVALVQFPFFLANTQTMAFSGRLAGDPLYIGKSIKQLFLSYSYGTPPWFPQVPMLLAVEALVIACWIFLRGRTDFRISEARNALIIGVVALLMPLADAVSMYVFSVLHIAGFAFLPNGDFGGPFDFRFRHPSCFLAVAATALAADFLWRYFARPNGLGVKLKEHFRLFLTADGRLRAESFALRCVLLSLAMALVLQAVPFGSSLTYYFKQGTRMRNLGREGANFLSYYAHPDLLKLASERRDFSKYRVATVEIDDRSERVPGLNAGFQTAYGFETADGYMSNVPIRYVDFWDLMLTGVPSSQQEEFTERYQKKFQNVGSAFKMKLFLYEPAGSRTTIERNCARIEKPIDFSSLYNLPMLSLANVEYIVSAVPIADRNLTLLESEYRERLKALECKSWGERRRAYWADGLYGRPLYIYRNERVLPRVFTPRSVELFDSDAALQQKLIKRSAAELATRLLARRGDFPAQQAANKFTVQVGSFGSNVADVWSIDVDTTAGGPIVIGNNFSPYWKAFADGKQTETFPAYHTFTGVWVPAGARKIELRYLPPYARWANRGS